MEEFNDSNKKLLENKASVYLLYFISRFPRLLLHCYTAVEEASHLFVGYFHQHDDNSPQPMAGLNTLGIRLRGSELFINCQYDLKFPNTKVFFDTLVVKQISNLFVMGKKSFTNFLQKNSTNVTELKLSSGSLKFDSVTKVLQKLPHLRHIYFDQMDYEAVKANRIEPEKCHQLMELTLIDSGNMLQPFLECPTIKKLTIRYPELTLTEIVDQLPSLEELIVQLYADSLVSHALKEPSDQLIRLEMELHTNGSQTYDNILRFLCQQNNLTTVSFTIYGQVTDPQPFYKELVSYIFELEHLTSMDLVCVNLLKEVQAFIEGNPTPNTKLVELLCRLEDIQFFPASVIGHFTSLKILNIGCGWIDKENIYDDLCSALNKSKLTSLKLRFIPTTICSRLRQLRVKTLEDFHLKLISRCPEKEDIIDLQEFLLAHPNIKFFKLEIEYKCNKLHLLDVIEKVVKLLTKLERLEVNVESEVRKEDVDSLQLKTVATWRINEFTAIS